MSATGKEFISQNNHNTTTNDPLRIRRLGYRYKVIHGLSYRETYSYHANKLEYNYYILVVFTVSLIIKNFNPL